jgi:CBS domain-containing protein
MPMTVKAILSRKGNDVVTIKPTATLGDAVKILDMHRIGAVVITGADRQILGILSEEMLCAPLPTTPELQVVVNFATNPSKR